MLSLQTTIRHKSAFSYQKHWHWVGFSRRTFLYLFSIISQSSSLMRSSYPATEKNWVIFHRKQPIHVRKSWHENWPSPFTHGSSLLGLNHVRIFPLLFSWFFFCFLYHQKHKKHFSHDLFHTSGNLERKETNKILPPSFQNWLVFVYMFLVWALK